MTEGTKAGLVGGLIMLVGSIAYDIAKSYFLMRAERQALEQERRLAGIAPKDTEATPEKTAPQPA